jgi:hypothetical protein
MFIVTLKRTGANTHMYASISAHMLECKDEKLSRIILSLVMKKCPTPSSAFVDTGNNATVIFIDDVH